MISWLFYKENETIKLWSNVLNVVTRMADVEIHAFYGHQMSKNKELMLNIVAKIKTKLKGMVE